MNRIDRLHAILTHLQSKKRVTAQQLAERFDLSLRTVYRDIKALEESGVPVLGEAGVGYSVMEGYRLPPVMFTQEEATALLVGAKLAEQFTDSSVRKQTEAAIFKVKAVLRAKDKDFVDTLAPLINIQQRQVLPEGLSQQYITTILSAIGQKNVVQLSYRANYKEEITQRSIEPIGVSYYGQAWHLIAWCRLRNDYRDFRLSRVQKMVVSEESFEGTEHPSIEEYVQKIMRTTELQEVIVSFKRESAKFVGEQKYYYGFVSEEVRETEVQMKFLTVCLEHFSRWILTYTDSVKVEAPAALQEIMCRLARQLYEHYC